VRRRDRAVVYAAGGREVEFEESAFREIHLWPTGYVYAAVLGQKQSAVAQYMPNEGYPYKLAGFDGRGGRPAWVSDVWATSPPTVTGVRVRFGRDHDVELRGKGGTVFVFGVTSDGAYLEAFDMATGKCKYRFCSGYWFNWSEKWDLK
jgi:hypothetical protein